jgi:hypothetical protein
MSDERIFTTDHFRAAGKARGQHTDDFYRENLVGTLNRPPIERVDDAVEFLRGWGGLRTRRGGLTNERASEIIRDFIGRRQQEIIELGKVPLYELKPPHLTVIKTMYRDLSQKESKDALVIPGTGRGKLLHFLLPNTVLLWDDVMIRAPLLIDDTTEDFERYQRFGWRLVNHLISTEGLAAVESIVRDHESLTDCKEPLPKLIDELFYDRQGNRERAILQLGGLEPALSLDPPP